MVLYCTTLKMEILARPSGSIVTGRNHSETAVLYEYCNVTSVTFAKR